jgi:hypothetical protein
VKSSPAQSFSKKNVLEIINLITEPVMKQKPIEEPKPYMMSLYDYLGRAAGKELGAEVCATATTLQETIQERYIENPSYKGNVHLYRREFLDEYFGNKIYGDDVEPSLGDQQDYNL